MLDSTVSFSHYVFLSIHSRTFCLHTQTNFRFHRQKVSFPQLAWGDFHAHLLASLALIRHIESLKNYSAIARRKNIPFYPARTGINFSYFQLARRLFRFPSQLISQCFFIQPSSNSAWRADILSSGSVGYSCMVVFADCRPQTADCRPQTADRRPQTAECRVQTA